MPFAREIFYRTVKTSTILAAILGLLAPIQLCAQTKQVAPPAHIETSQEFGARLAPLEETEFDAATKAFDEHRYADSLASFKSLLKELPAEPLLIKFASEAALQSGDTTFALSQLIPIVKANPDDWRALSLLTRAYAESGDKINRDSGIAQMLVLHRRGVTPSGLQKYAVERIKEGDNALVIWTSLEPWGYKVYALGQVSDSNGLIFLRISLESNDSDQASFAREHPKEASQGVRQFSLDAYRETGLNNSGQRTQTHYTFQFFVGQPSYDTVREEFIKIATGKAAPISSRSNLVVP
jgi:hypothetical protein